MIECFDPIKDLYIIINAIWTRSLVRKMMVTSFMADISISAHTSYSNMIEHDEYIEKENKKWQLS